MDLPGRAIIRGTGFRRDRRLLVAALTVLFLPISLLQGEPIVQKVDSREQAGWLRWLIPLPKEISITEKVEVKTADVRIKIRDGASELEKNAAAILISLFEEKRRAASGSQPAGFEILLGVCSERGILQNVRVAGARDLRRVPNWEQAYAIRPLGHNRVALTAPDARGVYYAARTFAQLIQSRLSGDSVSIPLARITDWPDLSERGEWGGSAESDIAWFGEYKLNLVEFGTELRLNEDGRGVARLNGDLLARARLYAVKVVPFIVHLDYLRESGIYDRYPELAGVGESARAPIVDHPVALCFSKSRSAEILADWIVSLARQGVPAVNVWLSEYGGQCGCEECRKAASEGMPQHVMEALAVWKALPEARKFNPAIQLRILMTQGSYPSNEQIVKHLPREVGIEYYCGVGCPYSTYDSSRDPMIYPLLADYAAEGNWLGVYPQFTPSYGMVAPWSAPEFIKFRMTEYVGKKLKSVCGYVLPNNTLYDFNVTAAAEWAWNARGRSPREYSAAWATRKGFKDPEMVADWATLVGPVGWNLYGSGREATPFIDVLLSAARQLTMPKKMSLGQGLWRYFPTQLHMDNDLAACNKALALAEQLKSPALLAETRVISGYVTMVSNLYAIADAINRNPAPDEESRRYLQTLLQTMAEASKQVEASIEDWARALGQSISTPRGQGTLSATRQTVEEAGKRLAHFGIRMPSGFESSP